MLDIEVLLVVEDGDGLVVLGGGSVAVGVAALGADRDGGEIDLLGHGGGCDVAMGVWKVDVDQSVSFRPTKGDENGVEANKD